MTKYGLTPEKIEGQIANVDYSTFGETGILCVITLVNGYTVTGESSCIDPTIFNEDIGKEIAYKNAFDKLWFLVGYNEKQRWYEETQLTWLDRVRIELANLDDKRSKLDEMIRNGQPSFMSNEQFNLLKEQYDAMAAYALILAKRIEVSKVLKVEDNFECCSQAACYTTFKPITISVAGKVYKDPAFMTDIQAIHTISDLYLNTPVEDGDVTISGDNTDLIHLANIMRAEGFYEVIFTSNEEIKISHNVGGKIITYGDDERFFALAYKSKNLIDRLYSLAKGDRHTELWKGDLTSAEHFAKNVLGTMSYIKYSPKLKARVQVNGDRAFVTFFSLSNPLKEISNITAEDLKKLECGDCIKTTFEDLKAYTRFQNSLPEGFLSNFCTEVIDKPDTFNIAVIFRVLV